MVSNLASLRLAGNQMSIDALSQVESERMAAAYRSRLEGVGDRFCEPQILAYMYGSEQKEALGLAKSALDGSPVLQEYFRKVWFVSY